MIVVQKSNYDREFFFEKVVCTAEPHFASVIADALNKSAKRDQNYYYAVENDDYELYEFKA